MSTHGHARQLLFTHTRHHCFQIWDLSAGKLLRELELHEGPITTLDFHPNEFLLASGSQDRTVKFWDLETFDPVSSADPEATRILGGCFSPDGRVYLGATQDGMRVWEWEPVRSLDYVDVNWGNLVDMNISVAFSQLVACSIHQR